MTYLDQAALAADPDFNNRLSSALTTEGRAQIADPVAKAVMESPLVGVTMFMPFVSSAPGFADKYGGGGGDEAITDADILSAVQTVWADVAAVHDLTAAP